MTEPRWDDLLLVGRIARTHGLRGEVAIDAVSDFADERFRPGVALWTRVGGALRQVTIARMRVHQDRPLVSFEGLDSIEAVEALGKAELRMAADDMPPLPDDTYHHHDLVGCEVVTREGGVVGKVKAVEGTRTASLLVVDGRRGEVLVPLAASICVEVDPRARRIVVAPPEGLLDLN